MKLTSFIAIVSLLVCHQSLNAGIVLDILDTSFQAGGTGFVDVLISSTDGTDALQTYSGRFEITQISGTGVLEFQEDSTSLSALRQLDSERTLGVLASDLDLGAFFSDRQDPNKQGLVQSDSANSAVSVPTSPASSLLARLELQHVTPTPTESAVYRVSLIEDGFNTSFLDGAFAPLDIDASSFANSGTVTIAAVPEPSAAIFLCVVAGLVFTKKKATSITRVIRSWV